MAQIHLTRIWMTKMTCLGDQRVFPVGDPEACVVLTVGTLLLLVRFRRFAALLHGFDPFVELAQPLAVGISHVAIPLRKCWLCATVQGE